MYDTLPVSDNQTAHGGTSEYKLTSRQVKVAGAVNGPVLIDLSVPGELHLGFSDVRDCEAVMHMTHTLGFDWKLDYTSPIHLSMVRIHPAFLSCRH